MSPCFYMGYTGQLTPGADLPIQKNLAPCLWERQCCWGTPRLVRASAQRPAQQKQAPGAAAAGDKSWRKREPSAPHEQTSPSRDGSECGYLNQDVALRVSPRRRAAVSSDSVAHGRIAVSRWRPRPSSTGQAGQAAAGVFGGLKALGKLNELD